MFTKTFWLDLLERTIATFAGALVSVLIVVEGGIANADWGLALGTAAMAALITILKGLVASRIGDPESAALLPNKEE